MGPAPLRGRTGQHDADRVLQPLVGIGDDKCHPVEAASDETSQERRPARSVLGAYDIDAEDLPVAVCVHSRGDDSRQGDETSALAHLVEQGVQPDLDVRPLVQGTIAELGDLDIEVLRELGDLGLGHAVDAHRSHEVVDSSRGDPFDICLADHRDEGLLGVPAGLEERGM